MRRLPLIACGCIALFAWHALTTTAGEVNLPTLSFASLFNLISSERGPAIERAVAYGTLVRQRLDIYRPPNADERQPIVIFFYGGGWTEGDRATYQFVGTALASRGVTTVIADYRLYPEVEFPEFMDDAAEAYVWVARNLANGCTPSRPMIVMGHSAGGYMAALLALDPSYLDRQGVGISRPAAVIGLAGPYAFDPTTWPTTKKIFVPSAGNPDGARPVAFVKPDAPPALLLHGGADTVVRLYNTRDLAAALSKAGVEAQTIEYPGIGHVGLVLALGKTLRWRAPVLDDIMKFIDRHGGDKLLAQTCGAAAPR